MINRLFTKKNPLFFIGFVVFSLIVLGTIFIPMISSYNWATSYGAKPFEAPSKAHLYGTNLLGQDLFTGIWIGGRTSLMVAILGTLPYTLFGSLAGILDGYWGKRIGFLISQLMTFLYALPILPLLLMLSFLFRYMGLSQSQVVYASIGIYSLFSAPTLYKIVRAETVRINSEEYMRAAEILGFGMLRRISKHLLPNVIGHIIVASIQFVTQLLIIELVLFFFGLSFSPEKAPTWGSLIPNLDGPNTFKEFYWVWLFPILTVATTTISLKFISEGLRIAFDPKVEDYH